MANSESLRRAWRAAAELLESNTERLTQLDQAGGDGDLGISMRNGSAAALRSLEENLPDDLGLALKTMADAFNEAAPSSLGTILSFGMKGMAAALRGRREADTGDWARAMEAGTALIMQRAGSKPGEKTVLDAVCPAVGALRDHAQDGPAAWRAAAKAAADGAQSTRAMRAVWGRAAYQKDGAIGCVDGGAAAAALIFEALARSAAEETGH